MSAYMESDVLNDLEARAGASDTQRELWLAERRQGVTATEIRDVMIAANRDQAIADLVAKKRDGDSFTGNAYTRWGTDREPVIAFMLAGFGMVPEHRVFHAEGNSRHLASPDGLSLDFDGDLVLDEIKTSGKPLPKGGDELARKGYEWQMQWCCYVTGAVGCWLNVELRHGTPRTGFSAGGLSREWFPRDDRMIAAMLPVADRVLAAMDEGLPVLVVDEVVDTHAVNYLRGLDLERQAKALKEPAYRALVEAGVSQVSALAKVTYTPGTEDSEYEDEVIDLAAAAAAHPVETAALEAAKARVAELQAAWDALADGHTKKVMAVTPGKCARVTVTPVKHETKEAA